MRKFTYLSEVEREILILLASRRNEKEVFEWASPVSFSDPSKVLCNVCGEIFDAKQETCLMTSVDKDNKFEDLIKAVFVGSIEHGRKHLEESKLLGMI
jgi:hypothetical protein